MDEVKKVVFKKEDEENADDIRHINTSDIFGRGGQIEKEIRKNDKYTMKSSNKGDSSERDPVIKFPTYKPEDRTDRKPIAARMKAKADIMELDYKVVTDPRVYDEHRATKIAPYLNTTSRCDQEGSLLKYEAIPLISSKISPNGQYFMGMINEDYLHLTPVSNISQFRPNIRYLDKIEERIGDNSQVELSDKEEEESEYEDQLKILSIKVESSDEIQNKLTKLSQLTQEVESEPWINLDLSFCNNHNDILEVLCPKRDINHLKNTNFSSTIQNFGLQLQKNTYYTLNDKPFKVKSGISLSECRSYPLNRKILSYMVNVILTRFDTLKTSINVFDEQEILKVLTLYAVLVNGIWVIKSEFMYKGLPALARNWLLYMLSTSSYVKRAEFCFSCKLPYDICTSILIELTTLVPKIGWRLKLNEDITFCKRYPQLTLAQNKKIKEDGLESASRLASIFT